ncbi:MAG TPA: hypothetical protein PLP27_03200 [Crocinitomicaceae bacterium]|nr:hypothetical protein [Crocinitomicaceae bacterium]
MNIDNQSRIWVYQSDRPFLTSELEVIQREIDKFTAEWHTHGKELNATGTIVDNHFVVLGVDANSESTSGCSIDSSVRFIKELGQKLDINFFDRLKILTVDENGNTEYVSHYKLKEMPNRMMYNPLVDTLSDLKNNFKISVQTYLDMRK